MGYMKRSDAKQQRLTRAVANTTVKTTMQRRKFLIGAGALASGSAAAIGTGAFTSVEADRDVTVEVADDADAFLALSESGEPNDEYFVEEDGEAGIDLGENEEGATGVNLDSQTKVFNIMEVQNQGTQDVLVYTPEDGIEGDDSFETFDPHATDLPGDASEVEDEPWTLEDEVNLTDPEPFGDPDLITLEPGQSFNLGLWMNPADDAEVGDTDEITITLEADASMVED